MRNLMIRLLLFANYEKKTGNLGLGFNFPSFFACFSEYCMLKAQANELFPCMNAKSETVAETWFLSALPVKAQRK